MKKLFCLLLILSLALSGCYKAEIPQTVDTPEAEEVIPNDTDTLSEKESVISDKKTPEPSKETTEASDEQIPDEPKDTAEPDFSKGYCSLMVKCDTPGKLPEEKRELIPENGIIYYNENIKYNENETVFDLLLRTMKENRIHIEYEYTPAFSSSYVEGIANLYEFDAGELSGWRFKVNSKIPSTGSSQYIIKDNDNIEWIYYCE